MPCVLVVHACHCSSWLPDPSGSPRDQKTWLCRLIWPTGCTVDIPGLKRCWKGTSFCKLGAYCGTILLLVFLTWELCKGKEQMERQLKWELKWQLFLILLLLLLSWFLFIPRVLNYKCWSCCVVIYTKYSQGDRPCLRELSLFWVCTVHAVLRSKPVHKQTHINPSEASWSPVCSQRAIWFYHFLQHVSILWLVNKEPLCLHHLHKRLQNAIEF